MNEAAKHLRRHYGKLNPDDTSTMFAAFILSHAECGDEVRETRMDEHTVACLCLRCGEDAVFGPRVPGGHSEARKSA